MTYEFGSIEWFAALHGAFAQRAVVLESRYPGARTSICEVFTNAPPDLAAALGELAWSCVCEAGRADFRLEERDDVQFKVRGDFEGLREIARYDTQEDSSRLADIGVKVAALRAMGKLSQIQGDHFAEPSDLGLAHDVVARLTA